MITDSQIIDALGGNQKVGKITDTDPAVVSGWRTRGFPKQVRRYLALRHPRIVKAVRKQA